MLQGEFMLFEPPIDDLVEKAGCRYSVAVIVGAQAKELSNKIPTLLNGSDNIAIDYAAKQLYDGEVVGVRSN